MKIFRRGIASALVLALVGCDQAASIRALATPARDDYARAFVAHLANRDMAAVQASLAPALLTIPGIADSLIAVDGELPPAPLDTVRLVGAFRLTTGEGTQTRLSYEIHGGSRWAVVMLALVESGGRPVVQGVRAERLPRSLSETNRFADGWSLAGALFIALMVCAVLYSCWTAGVIVRSGRPRRWRWAALCLLGFGTVTLDWTAGAFRVDVFRVLLLSAAFLKQGVAAPWLLSVAFPLGAVLARWRLKVWQRRLIVSEAPAPVESPIEAPVA